MFRLLAKSLPVVLVVSILAFAVAPAALAGNPSSGVLSSPDGDRGGASGHSTLCSGGGDDKSGNSNNCNVAGPINSASMASVQFSQVAIGAAQAQAPVARASQPAVAGGVMAAPLRPQTQPQAQPAAQAPVQGGQATIVVANNFKVPMTFRVDSSSFTIQPGNGQIVTLSAGNHTYMGAVAGWEGVNGTISLPAGQTFSILARPGRIDSGFDVNGKPNDSRSLATGLTWVEWWQGPAGNRLPVQNPGSGAGALVLENYLGTSLNVTSGLNDVYNIAPFGRVELIKIASPVIFTISAALKSPETSLNGAINLAPGQISVLTLNLDGNGNLYKTLVPSGQFQ